MHLKTVVLALACHVLCACGEGSNNKPGTQPAIQIEFYLGQYEPNEAWQTCIDPDTNETIYLLPNPPVTTADIIAARITPEEFGKPSVIIDINGQAADRLRNATQNHLNKPAVIMIDGNVAVVAKIRAALSNSFMITNDMTQAEAQSIVDKLKN